MRDHTIANPPIDLLRYHALFHQIQLAPVGSKADDPRRPACRHSRHREQFLNGCSIDVHQISCLSRPASGGRRSRAKKQHNSPNRKYKSSPHPAILRLAPDEDQCLFEKNGRKICTLAFDKPGGLA